MGAIGFGDFGLGMGIGGFLQVLERRFWGSSGSRLGGRDDTIGFVLEKPFFATEGTES